ncbi:MAG TPA: substrate-binding domain-containing protein [Bacteroidota bacterium]|nr:substrate-binding domain-containing protein [Bacteroidota bacterium]
MKRIRNVDPAKEGRGPTGSVSSGTDDSNAPVSQAREYRLEIPKDPDLGPKGAARNLTIGLEEKSIGVIVKDLNYPFYTSVVAGAKEHAIGSGYAVVVASSDDDHESEKKLSHLFSAKDIKGTIMAPIVEGAAEIEHLFRLKRIGYPFVLLEPVRGIQANVVSIDNVKAIKTAVKYLMDGGHRRIVHFAGPQQSSHTQERIAGFRQAFSESSLVFRPEMIVAFGSHYDACFAKALAYFKGRNREEYPTAIVCFNDQQALAVMMALREMNIRVPDDVSIVGIDDIDYARVYPVPLTSIRTPQREIGRKAAEILIRNIESPAPPQPEQVSLDTELIIRQSTKALIN